MTPKSSLSSSLSVKTPVVVILGHVDHGKTTLLDAIRKTNIVAKEVGGITQRIGAYQVTLSKIPNTITFIDTPGHEAFTKMRSRGTKVADLAILVVAADSGVQPQTKESIKYIKENNLPFLVAINKIDLPGISIPKIRGQLAEEGVLTEGFGGQIVTVPVSAKTGEGLDKLIEIIVLMAEMEELKTDPTGPFSGFIIESKLDQRRGPVATILGQNGTLKVGDEIVIEKSIIKIKAMFDENGKRVPEAGPAFPVEILGLKKVASIGTRVASPSSNITASTIIKKEASRPSLQTTESQLKIILKVDTIGSLEAIVGSFSNEVLLISSGTGEVTQSDLDLASTSQAQIYAFNVNVPKEVQKQAAIEGVKIHQYKIIYELLEDIERQVLIILEPTINEEIIGQAKIIAEFQIDDIRVAGAKVIEGKITKSEKVHLKRGEKIIGDAKIVSMKHEKENIAESKLGQEFGATFSPPLDFKIGDSIIAYKKP